jgi:hypothetical protein
MEETKYITIPIDEYKEFVLLQAQYKSRNKVNDAIVKHFITKDKYDLQARSVDDLTNLSSSYRCAISQENLTFLRSIGIVDAVIEDVIRQVVLDYKLNLEEHENESTK